MSSGAAAVAGTFARLQPRGIPGFILRRIVLGIVTLFLVSIVVFAATQTLPGDTARAILGLP